MKLVITDGIRKSELLKNHFSLNDIKVVAKKSLTGLGITIKSTFKIPATCLSKVYITSSKGAARVVFLLKMGEEKAVLVVLRMKQDKLIGSNISVSNPAFQKLLDKNLNIIISDLEFGNFTEYSLD